MHINRLFFYITIIIIILGSIFAAFELITLMKLSRLPHPDPWEQSYSEFRNGKIILISSFDKAYKPWKKLNIGNRDIHFYTHRYKGEVATIVAVNGVVKRIGFSTAKQAEINYNDLLSNKDDIEAMDDAIAERNAFLLERERLIQADLDKNKGVE